MFWDSLYFSVKMLFCQEASLLTNRIRITNCMPTWLLIFDFASRVNKCMRSLTWIEAPSYIIRISTRAMFRASSSPQCGRPSKLSSRCSSISFKLNWNAKEQSDTMIYQGSTKQNPPLNSHKLEAYYDIKKKNNNANVSFKWHLCYEYKQGMCWIFTEQWEITQVMKKFCVVTESCHSQKPTTRSHSETGKLTASLYNSLFYDPF